MASKPFEITFRPVQMPPGVQDRLALHVGTNVICRTPALKPGKGLSTTAPGSVVYVLSKGSGALKRIQSQLEEGSRVLVPCKTKAQVARMERSVATLSSFLTPKQAREAKANWAALKEAEGAKPATKAKPPEAQVSPEELEAFRAWKAGTETKGPS
jgi:hypothetical protein